MIKGVLNKTLSIHSYISYLKDLKHCHIIGINAAYELGDIIDILFFGDKSFYRTHRKALLNFKGIKVTCSNAGIENYKKENIKYMFKNKEKVKGITIKTGLVSWNFNSGAASISLAVQLGVKRIYLLGFDMKLDENNNQHWHNVYDSANRNERERRKLPFRKHLGGFSVIAEDAKKLGIEIINLNSDSAINCFKKMNLEDIVI